MFCCYSLSIVMRLKRRKISSWILLLSNLIIMGGNVTLLFYSLSFDFLSYLSRITSFFWCSIGRLQTLNVLEDVIGCLLLYDVDFVDYEFSCSNFFVLLFLVLNWSVTDLKCF